MNRHLDEDEILDLILELLPRDREQALLGHVMHCPPCEESMRRHGARMERIASTQAGDVRVVHPPVKDVDPVGSAPAGRFSELVARMFRGRRVSWVLPAAALALVLILWMPRERSAPMMPEPNWLPSGTSIVQRQETPDRSGSEALAEGLEAYARRDLPGAIDRLEHASVGHQLDSFRLLYLGSALALAGDFHRAASVLRPVTQGSMPEPWATEAYWTLFVALERDGQSSSADSLRRALADRPGELGERLRRLSKRTR